MYSASRAHTRVCLCKPSMPVSAHGEAARNVHWDDRTFTVVRLPNDIKLRMMDPIDNYVISIDSGSASREGFRRPHQPASSGKVVLVRKEQDVAGTATK